MPDIYDTLGDFKAVVQNVDVNNFLRFSTLSELIMF
jgi:hypothetical protein